MLNELLSEEVISLNIECNNWKQAIKAGTALLVSRGCIEKGYEDAIFNQFDKLGPYMVVAPGIALSHARPQDGVKKLSLSLITLKRPVNFGSEINDPVKLIITLAAVDNKTHLKTLEQLMELLMNSEDLNTIMNTQNIEKVLEIIDKYSKY